MNVEGQSKSIYDDTQENETIMNIIQNADNKAN